MFLEMVCDKCAVAGTCPRKGSSPILVGKSLVKCRIVNGFGKKPIEKHILSPESLKISERDGPCLTVAEVPSFSEGELSFDVVKIFSPPVLAQREMTQTVTSSDVTVRSHK